eukprot:gnl/MRDRNA2_/MRDRNA2_101417_c0_seq1.p1 gnl/MRDRNA2_/MRDRNA2_101417_c0~~gnl/MRDRNA2_/MRDRNA2_101417_c0_seq1.p1  ORF type:complete len:736 (+),score=241.76 gnl/MRDRNA2_/MRDRNA2_101417_c0_seq1:108-2315(+)
MVCASFRALFILLLLVAVEGAAAHLSNVGRRLFGKDKDQSKSNVIDKVIEMLDAEKAKIATDIQTEAKTMDEYFDYCDDTKKEKDFAIRDAATIIEDSSALIEDNTAQIKALDIDIEQITIEMDEKNEEFKKAEKVRAKEHEEFKKREAQQVIMVDELAKMEMALKQQIEAMTTPPPVELEGPAEEAEEAGALLQISHSSKSNTASASQMLTPDQTSRMKRLFSRTVNAMMKDPEVAAQGKGSFLQQAQMEEPQQNTADSLAAFEGLKKKAEDALNREREQDKKEANELMVEKQALMGATKLLQNKLDDCNEDKNKLAEELAQAQGELKAAVEAKAKDEKYVEELTYQCEEAAKAWDARQQQATDEQAAITKACEILSSRVTVFAQKGQHNAAPLSFLQVPGVNLDAPQHISAAVRQKLINHFRSVGTKLKSISMLNMVSAVSVSPMDKIKGLIKDMIAKLQKEALEAANTHAFCQAEQKKNDENQEKTQGELDKTNNAIDTATAKKDQLEDRVAVLRQEIAAIDNTTAEAEHIRQEENAQFKKDRADFQEAADAVLDAMDVLNEYYKGAGSFVQTNVRTQDATKGARQPVKAIPKMGGAKSASAGGILSILDMMADNFQKTVGNLDKAEEEAVIAFKKLKQESFESKTAKDLEASKAEQQISFLKVNLEELGTDLSESQKTMDTILEYIDKLKPTCENRVVPYAERKAKREAEIEGLKEAFQILVDTSASMETN